MSIHIPLFSVPGTHETFHHHITEEATTAYAALIGMPPGEDDCNGKYSSISNHYMVGVISGLLNNHFSSQGLECLNLHFEFLSAIVCGSDIDTTIELVSSDPVKNLTTFKVDCFNQSGDQVITGQAVMILPH
jgi:hypothetical protein